MGLVRTLATLDDARQQISRGVTDGIESFSISWLGASSNPAIGNGTSTCKFQRTRQWVDLWVQIVVGSTTSFGSGVWSFTPPVAAAFSTPICQGSAWCYDLSATRTYLCVTEMLGVNGIYIQTDGTGGRISSSVPFTWATGDILNFSIRYPILET